MIFSTDFLKLPRPPEPSVIGSSSHSQLVVTYGWILFSQIRVVLGIIMMPSDRSSKERRISRRSRGRSMSRRRSSRRRRRR